MPADCGLAQEINVLELQKGPVVAASLSQHSSKKEGNRTSEPSEAANLDPHREGSGTPKLSGKDWAKETGKRSLYFEKKDIGGN